VRELQGNSKGNAAYKLFSNIILEKIKPYFEKISGDYQSIFSDGSSVIDNIFALNIINEKTWEYNQSVQYLSIDFQKAYDSIHGDMLWKCMEEFKNSCKINKYCKTCVQKTRNVVRIEGTTGHPAFGYVWYDFRHGCKM
jgi:hypothetical protein